MRIAYLDCFAGLAGDMFLGALLHAGVPEDVLQNAAASLRIGASLRVETVDRSGISAVKVHVLEAGELAESQRTVCPGSDDSQHHQASREAHATHSHQPLTQHLHKDGHGHTHSHAQAPDQGLLPGDPLAPSHSHPHEHGRSLPVIREIIQAAALHPAVKNTALRAFELLGSSEAKIHNVPVESIHFHEVGAVDAIVDIVAASAGIHHLQIGRWYCSPVNVGAGTVQCAHGTFPVPAPATADLLRGVPTYSAHVQKELVTPTGAALLRALDPTFGQQPAMAVEAIGYGAGTRNPEGFPNVLRLSFGEGADPPSSPSRESLERANADAASSLTGAADTVTVLEAALDDLSPQVLAYAAERALAAGALDVMLTPVVMKKGRPGTLITVLCQQKHSQPLQEMLLRETSTLGFRMRTERRVLLQRAHVEVATAFGSLRVKVGSAAGEEWNAAPEFEDCRAAARQHGVPLKVVQQAALAAYRGQAPR